MPKPAPAPGFDGNVRNGARANTTVAKEVPDAAVRPDYVAK